MRILTTLFVLIIFAQSWLIGHEIGRDPQPLETWPWSIRFLDGTHESGAFYIISNAETHKQYYFAEDGNTHAPLIVADLPPDHCAVNGDYVPLTEYRRE